MGCVDEHLRSQRATRTVFGGRATDGQPTVTYAIIAICVVVWVAMMANDRVFSAVAFAPFLGDTEPWRMVTSAFAHSTRQPMHILFNMYALWVLGQYLEPMLGRARFVAIYALSAVGGSLGFLLMSIPPSPADVAAGNLGSWVTPVVGASGAVFGLFGALLVLNRRLNRSSQALYVVLGINAVLGFVIPNVAWQAHLGGFVVGAAAAAAIATLGKPGARSVHWVALGGIGVLLVLATFAKYALS